MTFFLQLFIFLSQLFNIFSQLFNNRMNHLMFFVQLVSQLTFSFLTFLLNLLNHLFQFLHIFVVLLFQLLVTRFEVSDFLFTLSLFFFRLLFMFFVGLAKLTILLSIKVRFLLHFDHAFHHGHWQCATLVSDPIDVNLELFLNTIQFDTKFSNDVSLFSFFQFKIFFGLNLI